MMVANRGGLMLKMRMEGSGGCVWRLGGRLFEIKTAVSQRVMASVSYGF